MNQGELIEYFFFTTKRGKTQNNTFEMHKTTTTTTTTRKQTTLKTSNENGKLVDNFFSLSFAVYRRCLHSFTLF